MAIRGPGGPRPEPGPSPTREQPQSPTQRLMDFGAARTPQEALKLLKEIIALLAGAGFPVPPSAQKGEGGGGEQQQFSSMLKQLQKREGLPQTGQLDKKTFEALDRLGLLPKTAKEAEALEQKTTNPSTSETKFSLGGPRLGAELGLPRGGSDVPAGTQKTRSVETEQAKARVDNSKPEVQVDLKRMLNSLRQAGFAGVGKGKEQLQDAVKKLQRVDGLPVTGQLDAKTAAALEKRGVIDTATAQALKEQDPTYTPRASDKASSTETPSDQPQGTVRGSDSRGAGGNVSGDGAGRGVVGGDGRGVVEGGDGVVDDGDDGGDSDAPLEEGLGNNYAGDDDLDDDARGKANVDGDGDADVEHWEVKKLAVQIDDALAAIVRDDDGSGAATYGWDLRLFRPGVYSARQPAEELLHLVVKSAGPFDPVWQQALAAVNERLRRYEPDAAFVDSAALKLALQRARYRA